MRSRSLFTTSSPEEVSTEYPMQPTVIQRRLTSLAHSLHFVDMRYLHADGGLLVLTVAWLLGTQATVAEMNTRNEELEKMLYEHITKDMTHKKFVKEVGKSSSSYMVSSRVDYRRRHVCVVVRLSFIAARPCSPFRTIIATIQYR